MIRAFIALTLPPRLKKALAQYQERMRTAVPGVKWVERENLHLTLRFLGEIDDDQAAAIPTTLTALARNTAPITTGLNGIGFFPDARRPRVVFAGLTTETALIELAARLEKALKPLGFAPTAMFNAHVTLARFKAPPATVALNLPPLPDTAENFTLSELTLFKSTLEPWGPVYTPLYNAKLSAP